MNPTPLNEAENPRIIALKVPQLNSTVRGSYKRPFDLAVLVAAHILLLPLWVVLWTAIPLMIWVADRGPVFYTQKRSGKDGKIFTVRKFRTMIPNADQCGPAWTMEDDPRVTKVGKILRRTALDELPELISVWKGDMSLVGPRALDVGEQESLELQIEGFSKRLRARPGLTGLAQVYDLVDNDREKFAYDRQYLEEMAPLLDGKLLVLSVWNTIFGRWDRRNGKSDKSP